MVVVLLLGECRRVSVVLLLLANGSYCGWAWKWVILLVLMVLLYSLRGAIMCSRRVCHVGSSMRNKGFVSIYVKYLTQTLGNISTIRFRIPKHNWCWISTLLFLFEPDYECGRLLSNLTLIRHNRYQLCARQPDYLSTRLLLSFLVYLSTA